MDDNLPTTEPTPVAEPTTEPTEAPAAEPQPEADVPAWIKALDEADAKELRKHPKFAGILGSELERERRTWGERQALATAEQARKDAEAELERLAEDDPVAFAERFKVDRQQAKLKEELAGLKASARDELARNLGRAYQGVPEWVEFTEREFEELAKAVAGKSDDEVIGAWNAKALELVADKRAGKKFESRFQEWKDKELAKEREAIRQEEAAKLLANAPKPDVSRPTRTGPAVHPLYQKVLETPAHNPEYDTIYDRWATAGFPK